MILPQDCIDLASDDEKNAAQETKDTSEEMQGIMARVMKEVTNEGITLEIFAKVVINATNETLKRLFQSGGVGYERYVQMIVSFLDIVPLEERRKRYKQQTDQTSVCSKSQEGKKLSAVEQILKSPPKISPILMHFDIVAGTEKQSPILLQPKTEDSVKQVLSESEPNVLGSLTEPSPRVRVRNRTYISDAAKEILNEHFDQDPYPNWHKRDVLGQKVGLSAEVIRIYYQNRRRLLGSDKFSLSSKDLA